MELSKKTTILFSPQLHKRLGQLARRRGVSMGELVRKACEECYGLASTEDRLEAVRRLGALSLPVGSPEQLERESMPDAEDLMP